MSHILQFKVKFLQVFKLLRKNADTPIIGEDKIILMFERVCDFGYLDMYIFVTVLPFDI